MPASLARSPKVTRSGRPKIEAAIRSALQADGVGIRKISTKFGVGAGTVPPIKGDMVAWALRPNLERGGLLHIRPD
jgi:hypothetical protein